MGAWGVKSLMRELLFLGGWCTLEIGVGVRSLHQMYVEGGSRAWGFRFLGFGWDLGLGETMVC
jgi:hypothetical protein